MAAIGVNSDRLIDLQYSLQKNEKLHQSNNRCIVRQQQQYSLVLLQQIDLTTHKPARTSAYGYQSAEAAAESASPALSLERGRGARGTTVVVRVVGSSRRTVAGDKISPPRRTRRQGEGVVHLGTATVASTTNYIGYQQLLFQRIHLIALSN